MLTWAVIFLVIAIIAAAFGFRGIASTSTNIAKILFVLFLVMFLFALIFSLFGGGAETLPTVS